MEDLGRQCEYHIRHLSSGSIKCTHLLGLLGLDSRELLLTASLGGNITSLGVEAVIPPAEAGGIVANEALVVHVVVVGTSPERQDVAQAEGEIVAGVGIDGLEETEDDPDIHGGEMEVLGEGDPENRGSYGTDTEKHDLNRGGVLGGETKGRAVGVVNLVDSLVERAVVKRAVEPVVPGILHDEEDADVEGHLPERREGHAIVEAEVGGDGVEEPDLGELDGAVTEENEAGALELFLPGGALSLCGC